MPAAAAICSAPDLAICVVQQAVLRVGELDVGDVVGRNRIEFCPTLTGFCREVERARISADPNIGANRADGAERCSFGHSNNLPRLARIKRALNLAFCGKPPTDL